MTKVSALTKPRPDPKSEIEIQFQLINTRLEMADLRLSRIEQLVMEIRQIVANGRTDESD